MISSEMQSIRDQELIKIKKVNMERVLSDLGVPVQQIGKTRMFTAFWRSEKTASCQIMPHKGGDEAHIFQDFGGKNGTNIDLAVFAKGSYSDGVKWLRNQYLSGNATAKNNLHESPSVSVTPTAATTPTPTPGWKILENEHPFKRFGKALVKFRRVTWADCDHNGIRALRIQNTQNTQKKFWVCAFPLISGGWTCFLPEHGKFRTVIAPNGLGWVKGLRNEVIIAESICDGIAAQKLTGFVGGKRVTDLLICPTKLAARAGKALLKRLKSKGKYDVIINAMDNDSPGEEASERILYYIGTGKVGPVQRLELTRKDPCDELLKGAKVPGILSEPVQN